ASAPPTRMNTPARPSATCPPPPPPDLARPARQPPDLPPHTPGGARKCRPPDRRPAPTAPPALPGRDRAAGWLSPTLAIPAHAAFDLASGPRGPLPVVVAPARGIAGPTRRAPPPLAGDSPLPSHSLAATAPPAPYAAESPAGPLVRGPRARGLRSGACHSTPCPWCLPPRDRPRGGGVPPSPPRDAQPGDCRGLPPHAARKCRSP